MTTLRPKEKTLAHPTKKEGLHVVCKSDTPGAEPDGLRRREERDVTKVEEPLHVGPISCPPNLTVVSAAQPCTATVSWCTRTIAVPRENG